MGNTRTDAAPVSAQTTLIPAVFDYGDVVAFTVTATTERDSGLKV
jgi:hypothetical protein